MVLSSWQATAGVHLMKADSASVMLASNFETASTLGLYVHPLASAIHMSAIIIY